MKILVRKLNRDISENELFEMFKSFGTIESCDLVLDKVTGKSKGFGFIQMPIEEEGKSAIDKLNGRMFRGMKIRVKRTVRFL